HFARSAAAAAAAASVAFMSVSSVTLSLWSAERMLDAFAAPCAAAAGVGVGVGAGEVDDRMPWHPATSAASRRTLLWSSLLRMALLLGPVVMGARRPGSRPHLRASRDRDTALPL